MADVKPFEKEEPQGPVGLIRALSSIITQRVRWWNQAGYTFDGVRDAYKTLGYKRELELRDYRSRYERGGIAGRIVDMPAHATWRGEGELIEVEDPDTETTFEKEWKVLNERLNIWNYFLRADILAGIGHYSVIVLGAPGDSYMDPLESLKADDLKYLTVYAEDEATIQKWNNDIADERYGKPEVYQLTRMNPAYHRQTIMAHHSRCVHIPSDGVLEDDIFGKPRLKLPWNLLDDLDKVLGGGAEAFWKRADQGMQINIHPDVKVTPQMIEQLETEVEEYVHGLSRIVRTRGVDMNTLGSDVANIGPNASALMDQISAVTSIPQRILMGSERGELASSQDKTAWDDRVSDRRLEYAQPFVVKPFVDRLIELGAISEPKEGYRAYWPQVKNLKDTEKAAIATQLAGLNAAAGEVVVLPAEIREKVLDWPPFTEEQKKEIEELEKEQSEAAQKETDDARAFELEKIKAGKKDPALEGEEEEEEGAVPEKKPPFAPKAAADRDNAVRAMTLARVMGRRALNEPALRDAIARNDKETIQEILTKSVGEVERVLRH